jgi:predicted GNAT family N-acyltransferase
MQDWARAVRLAVFVNEQGFSARDEFDEHDLTAVHAVALDASGSAVGTARLFVDGHESSVSPEQPKVVVARLGRVAVMPEARRMGLASALIDRLVQVALIRGMDAIELHAQTPARRLYERAGFVVSGPAFDEEGVPHLPMRLRLTDYSASKRSR